MLAVILVIVVGTIKLIGTKANTVFSENCQFNAVTLTNNQLGLQHSKLVAYEGFLSGMHLWLLTQPNC